MKQIVTIEKNGKVSGLQHRKGYDLRSIGKAKIERISEVLFDEKSQMWYVKFLRAPKPFKVLDYNLLGDARNDKTMKSYLLYSDAFRETLQVALFDQYEEAVEAEVLVLDWLRVQGVF